MKFCTMLCTLAAGLLVLGWPCAALPVNSKAAQPHGSLRAAVRPAVDTKATQKEAQNLHKQLETLATRLDSMLQAQNGAFGHTQAGPALGLFVKELHTVLRKTSKEADPAVALQQLHNAQKGVAGLLKELAARQEAIMREDTAQKESLFLGVLMTRARQKESMSKQLEILKDDDFKDLAVAKALLAKHDDKRDLYLQAAELMDQEHKGNHTAASQQGARVQQMVAVLNKTLNTLQHEYSARKRFHDKRVSQLKAKIGKALASKSLHLAEAQLKKENRHWKKWASQREHDIASMKDAVDAVKRGDMAAIARARNALIASMKALKSQSGGMLYLIQTGSSLMGQDCPYCVAQCVGTCHESGKTYGECMTDCADSGK